MSKRQRRQVSPYELPMKRSKSTHDASNPSLGKAALPIGNLGFLSEARNDDPNELPDDPVQYLLGVRFQATQLPDTLNADTLRLKASNGTVDDNKTINKSRAFFSDGAWIHAPMLGPARPPTLAQGQLNDMSGQDEDEHIVEQEEEYEEYYEEDYDEDYEDYEYYQDRALQEVFYARVLDQYRETQRILQKVPPGDHSLNLDLLASGSHDIWRHTFAEISPSISQFAALDSKSLLIGLTVMTRYISWVTLTGWKLKTKRKHGPDVARLIKGWLWGMLARLDAHTLNHEELAVVRGLGKKVVRLLEHPPSPDSKDGLSESDSESDGAGMLAKDEGVMSETIDHLEEAEAVDEDDYDHANYAEAVESARSVLIMVLTISGEVFGQSDLLRRRDIY